MAPYALVQIIEIALSICALRLRPTFWEAFYWRKVGRYALRSAPNFMKSTPVIQNNKILEFYKICLNTVHAFRLSYFVQIGLNVPNVPPTLNQRPLLCCNLFWKNWIALCTYLPCMSLLNNLAFVILLKLLQEWNWQKTWNLF